jgi:hypothetical protein
MTEKRQRETPVFFIFAGAKIHFFVLMFSFFDNL